MEEHHVVCVEDTVFHLKPDGKIEHFSRNSFPEGKLKVVLEYSRSPVLADMIKLCQEAAHHRNCKDFVDSVFLSIYQSTEKIQQPIFLMKILCKDKSSIRPADAFKSLS